jgi:Cu+-exporting ATPase
MRSDPRDVPAAIDLGQRTLVRVKQNLRWAFAYNAVLVPIAAFGLLNPLIAGVAMAFSTLPVLGNSLRIAREFHVSPLAAPVVAGTVAPKP